MRMETFIRKQYNMKVHFVESVREDSGGLVARVARFPSRRPRCGCCGRPALLRRRLKNQRTWRALSMGKTLLWIVYTPSQIVCRTCGVKIEHLPWSWRWERITITLAQSILTLARELSWKATAEHFGVSWKTVARIVREGVRRGLTRRRLRRVRTIGIDEVSRKKGHHYLTVVYDLEHGILVWVGKDRTTETLGEFFRWFGKRRGRSLEIVCMDMWAPYLQVVREQAPQATVVFDRFHLVRHINKAVDEVRRSEVRKLRGEAKVELKGSRFILLKNPWNLNPQEKRRLSSLVKLNNAVVRAYHLKEYFQAFWQYVKPGWAFRYLMHWRWMAIRSRLEPFKKFVTLLDNHLEGIMAWIETRVSNGALEGINNKIKLISHRAFGFRREENYIAAIYLCCGNVASM